MFLFYLQLLSETFRILRRTERDTIRNLYISCPVLTKLELSGQFSKNPQISNFMKIRPVGDEFHADERTDMTKLIIAFRNFANAPKN